MKPTHKESTDLIVRAKAWMRSPYAFPGGYEIACYMSDGGRLCRDCLMGNWFQVVHSTRQGTKDGWGLMGFDIYWEGPADFCCQCSHEFESEYGDPEEHLQEG